MARYKSGWSKFWTTLGVIFLILVLLGSTLAILNATVPAVHDFIVNTIESIKGTPTVIRPNILSLRR